MTVPVDGRELMGIVADIDFTYDARGRMVCTNEPRVAERRPAPRVYLGRTATGNVGRVGAALPDGIARRLAAIVEREPPAMDLRAAPAVGRAVRQELARDAPVTREGSGPVYRFPETIARAGGAIRLTGANREVVRDTYPWLYEQLADWQPCFVMVRDGAGVSVCFCSRVGARAAEAGVETLADFRGRGLASAATAAWGAAIREAGRVPIYITSWDNAASQGCARRVGLVMFGASVSWQ